MKKIVFLDIDGVLNCERCFRSHRKQWEDAGKPPLTERLWSMIEPGHVKHLNKLLADTGAQVVISSSWRGDPETPNILKENGVVMDCIGRTPGSWYEKDSNMHSLRGEEIQKWMDTNLESQDPDDLAYVILDDDSDMLPHQHFVQTDWIHGLDEGHVHRATQILNPPNCLNCGHVLVPVKDTDSKIRFSGHSWRCACMPANLVLSIG